MVSLGIWDHIYRGGVQLDLQRTGDTDEFTATVPGGFLVPQWDFMYFIEATSRAGHGVQWPDLAVTAPYVIVKLQRD